jgi:CubicO group peptidase (beta-lactamase class C family)
MTMRRPRLLTFVLFLVASAYAYLPASLRAQATTSDAASIVRRLRPVARVTGRPDTAFEIQDRMRHFHVPGVSIAIVQDMRITYAAGFGVTEFGGRVPVDTTTLFLAGSISKPVFTSGALALVEQGKLTLDDDINRYLESWRVPDSRFTEREKVTLRRLLTHSAGLTVWGFPGYRVDAPLPTVPQILDGTPPANTRAVRNDTFPGARWLYSGGGFTIAQLAASDVADEDFPSLMRRLVLAKADMRHSTYHNPPPPTHAAHAASGHERLDTPVPGRFHVYPEMAAAGLWTTPSDLARWAIAIARAYRGEPNGVISPAMAKQMLTTQVTAKPPYNGIWGLGVGLAGSGETLAFSHGGRDEGFVAQFVMYPEKGVGLFVMLNGVSGGFMGEVVRAFEETYGLPSAPRPEKTLVTPSPQSIADAVGHYRFPGNDSVEVIISRRGDQLWLNVPSLLVERRLLPQGADAWFDLDSGNDWTFERDTQGRVHALLRKTPGGTTRAARIPSRPRAPSSSSSSLLPTIASTLRLSPLHRTKR